MLSKAPTRFLMSLATVLALGACTGSPARQDKQNVQAARSLLAEWAMVSERHAAGELTETYYRQMRSQAEKQLATLSETAPRSGTAAGRTIALIAQVHGEPPIVLLRARADQAQAIEQSLEGL